MTTRVYVVDDHPVVCEGLVSALSRFREVEVVGSSLTGEHALPRLLTGIADVVLVDYSLPGMTGADLCAALRDAGAEVRCIVLSSATDAQTVRGCLAAGARGYLVKDVTPREIVAGLVRVAAGSLHLDPRATEAVVTGSPPLTAGPVCTEAEVRLLELISAGLPNHEIAVRLHVSTGTVKNRVSKLLTKLGASRRVEAAAIAARLGLLQQPEAGTGEALRAGANGRAGAPDPL